jgi:hypothetical protein
VQVSFVSQRHFVRKLLDTLLAVTSDHTTSNNSARFLKFGINIVHLKME